MDNKKPGYKKSDNIGNSSKQNDYYEGVSQGQSEKSIRKSRRIRKRNIPFEGEYTSENQSLSSSRSTPELSSHTSTPCLQVPNTINQHDETLSNADTVFSSRNTKRVFMSPSQKTTSAICEHSEASGSKCNQRSRSPFGEKCNVDFVSPPQCGSVRVASPLSKINTPSPEKRNVGMDAKCTPTKRIKKTPERNSGKLETKNESTRSATHTRYKSPKSLRAQKMKDSGRKNHESEFFNFPLTANERNVTESGSDHLTKAIDLRKSKLRASSSFANVFHKSPIDLQTLENKVIERNVEESKPFIEVKTFIYSFPNNLPSCSTDSNSLAKHSNPDNLRQAGNFFNPPTNKHDSEMHLDASTNLNLDRRKSKDSQSVPDASGESVLPKKSKTFVHPTTLTGSHLYNTMNDSRKLKERLASFEPCRHDSTANEPDAAVRPLEITNENFVLNLKTTPKPQNSSTENFEPCTEVKKSLITPVSSKEMRSDESVVLKRMLGTFQSSNKNLNSYLPLRRNSNVCHRVLEFETSNSIERTDRSRPHSPAGSSVPNSTSNRQSKETTALRNRRRRSKSDETLMSRNSPGVQANSNQPNSLLSSKGTLESRSFPEIESDVCRKSCAVKPQFRRSLPTSASTMTSAPRIPPEFRTQYNQLNTQTLLRAMEVLSSDEPSTTGNDREIRGQRNLSEPSSQGRRASSISREVVGSRTNPTYIDVFEGEASTSRYQPPVAVDSSFYGQPDFYTSTTFESSDTPREPLAADGLSDEEVDSSSSDSPPPGDAYERIHGIFEPFTPIRVGRCPETASEALVLLQPVLREMMEYSDDRFSWPLIAHYFLRFSESCSTENGLRLYWCLLDTLRKRKHSSVRMNLSVALDTRIETVIMEVHEQLMSLVIETLALIVILRVSRDYSTLMLTYLSFRDLYATFSQYCRNNNFENIEDESSRNRVKILKKMIQRFLLKTLMAFRLLLMYMGENANESQRSRYEQLIWQEDKKYFRRHI